MSHYLVVHGEGNPFVMTQLLADLEERGLLEEGPRGWRLRGSLPRTGDGSGPVVPKGVQAMLENRLARLNPRARRLLQVAAVIGRTFAFDLLLRVSGEPQEWVEICLSSWMARELVEELPGENTASPGAAAPHRYRFTHGMLHTTALAGLSDLQRRRLVERIEG